MTSDRCKNAVLEAWKAFASRDQPRIEACFTPDAEWLAPRGNATALYLRYPDHMVGRKQIAVFLAAEFHKLFVSDVRVDIKTVLADGHVVVLEERMRATLANGRAYENDYCFFFELDDEGRIHRVREYMDTQRGHECVFGGSERTPGRAFPSCSDLP